MTARQARTERRAAEREHRNMAARQSASNTTLIIEAPVTDPSVPPTRTEINRANSQHSTGPKTREGKANSSRNSFKHGLYSKKLIIPGEDPAELDRLRASLVAEHQPFNTTEHILVNELAEHFWRLRRMRELEARSWQPDNLDASCDNGLFALVQRSMASAERSFHKALTALGKLQKARGFVPQNQERHQTESPESGSVQEEAGFVHEEIVDSDAPDGEFVWLDTPETGFVPSNHHSIRDLLLSEDDEQPGDCSPMAA